MAKWLWCHADRCGASGKRNFRCAFIRLVGRQGLTPQGSAQARLSPLVTRELGVEVPCLTTVIPVEAHLTGEKVYMLV